MGVFQNVNEDLVGNVYVNVQDGSGNKITSVSNALSVTNLALGSVTGGIAGTQSSLMGLVYESSPVTLTNGQQAALQGTSSAQLITSDVNSQSLNSKTSPSVATLTQVAYSASSVSLLAVNPARKGLFIINTTAKAVLVAFAATTTTTFYTFILQTNGTYESQLGTYTGAISALWTGATVGNINITELT